MSRINPNYKGCVFCGQEECDCPYTGKETPRVAICTEDGPHQHGCICADCSGAELTSDND